MLIKKKKQMGRKKEKYNTSKDLPPDQGSLKMKILRASFTAHIMTNCLNLQYIPLDPSLYGWKIVENRWEPVWFEGSPLPHPDDILDQSGDDLESDKANVFDTAGESATVEHRVEN